MSRVHTSRYNVLPLFVWVFILTTSTISLSCEEIGVEGEVGSPSAYQECLARAESGEPYAMFKIGLAYVLGSGVEMNTFRAIYWYSQAVGASKATDRDTELQEAARQTIIMLWRGIQEKARGVAVISQETIDEQKRLIDSQNSLINTLESTLSMRDRDMDECLDNWNLGLDHLKTCIADRDHCQGQCEQ